MKHWLYYILFLLTSVVFVSCADEDNSDQYDDEPLQISVNAGWQCGRSISTSRAFVDPVTELGKIESDKILYPDWLHITLTNGTVPLSTFSPPLPAQYLVKKTISENDNYNDQKYIAYHAVYSLANYGNDETKREKKPFYSKSQIKKLSVEANTLSGSYVDGIPQAWDDQDVKTFGTIDHLTTKGIFGGSYQIERNHLFLDLGHATALLRLHFKVDKDYDKVRKIVLRSVKITKIGETTLSPNYEFTLNASQTIDTSIDDPATATVNESLGFLLTQASKLYAYGYMKPGYSYDGNTSLSSTSWTGAVSANTWMTIQCTYDIYENDIVEGLDPSAQDYETALATKLNDDLSAHCTRRSVTATNRFTFGTVTATDNPKNTITKIQAGHYYDLMITINPDYLYVLSEHDNKHHLTIQ